MNPKYLNLSRSQLSVAWNRSRFNHYSDSRKQKFHEGIKELFEKLMDVNFEDTSYTEDDLRFYKNVLEFLKKSLALLDNNTISSVPHEFIECLNVAAKEWISSFEKYIIVMNDGPYAIMPYVDDIEILYKSISLRFGVTFSNFLLSVSMPRQLSRDYFTNVCLFHELGHFVDTKLKISETVVSELMNKCTLGKQTEINVWFKTGSPAFNTIPTPAGSIIKVTTSSFSYLREYFADLFAAQYVGEKYLYFLDYISDTPKTDTNTHPSFEKRSKMYHDYCVGYGSNVVFDTILDITQSVTSQKINKRFVDIDPSDIYGLLPTILKDEKEIFSIFNLGWDAYMAGSQPFEKANGLLVQLSPDKLYETINNLIEKSINNFLVTRDWGNAKIKP